MNRRRWGPTSEEAPEDRTAHDIDSARAQGLQALAGIAGAASLTAAAALQCRVVRSGRGGRGPVEARGAVPGAALGSVGGRRLSRPGAVAGGPRRSCPWPRQPAAPRRGWSRGCRGPGARAAAGAGAASWASPDATRGSTPRGGAPARRAPGAPGARAGAPAPPSSPSCPRPRARPARRAAPAAGAKLPLATTPDPARTRPPRDYRLVIRPK